MIWLFIVGDGCRDTWMWKLAISNVPNGKRGTDEVLQSEGRMIQGCGNDSHIFSYSWNWFSGYGSQLSPSNVSSGMWVFKVRERHYSDVEMAPSSNWRDFLGLRVIANRVFKVRVRRYRDVEMVSYNPCQRSYLASPVSLSNQPAKFPQCPNPTIPDIWHISFSFLPSHPLSAWAPSTGVT